MGEGLTRKVLMTAGIIGRDALIDGHRVQSIQRAVLSLLLYCDDRMTPEEFAEILYAGTRISVSLDGDEFHGLWTFEACPDKQEAVLVLSSAIVSPNRVAEVRDALNTEIGDD